uniref:Acyltransferase n=1 Tax=Rhabditophanes sp. KR3021 TaxID=114890 RepID=A0AC35U1M6_9BILA
MEKGGRSKKFVEFAPWNVSLERRLQTFSVLFFLTIFLLLPVGVVGYVWVCFYNVWCLAVLVIYCAWWLIFDLNVPKRGSRPWKWFRNLWIWRYMANYFPVKVIKTAELPSDKNYIVGCHPHGILSISHFCNFGTNATRFEEIFPGIKPQLVTLSGQFMLPFRRELVIWAGGISSDADSIEYLLNDTNKGRAAAIVLGGAEEALEARADNYDLILSRRKGFCRIALKTGASLVPIYSFGENLAYNQVQNAKGSKLRQFQTKFKDITGFSPPIFHGRGIFQYTYGFVPFRNPINTVIGAPIHTKKNAKPTTEQIDALHAKYCEALIKLFDAHKTNYNIPDQAKLNIL